MLQCNHCAVHCSKIRSEWPVMRQSHPLSAQKLSRPCGNHVEPESFKVSLMERQLNKNARLVVQLLDIFKMKLIETHNRPYFVLDF